MNVIIIYTINRNEKAFFERNFSKGTQFTVITFAIEQIELHIHSVDLQQKILQWLDVVATTSLLT